MYFWPQFMCVWSGLRAVNLQTLRERTSLLYVRVWKKIAERVRVRVRGWMKISAKLKVARKCRLGVPQIEFLVFHKDGVSPAPSKVKTWKPRKTVKSSRSLITYWCGAIFSTIYFQLLGDDFSPKRAEQRWNRVDGGGQTRRSLYETGRLSIQWSGPAILRRK